MDLKKNNHKPNQWDIWLFNPDPVKGNEIGKKNRPCVVVSCNSLNYGPSGFVIVVPMTSKERKIPSHVQVKPDESGLEVVSFAICEQVRSKAKIRLIKQLGKIQNRRKILDIHEWLTNFFWIET
ncbi:MAG: Endoribonuclease MazF9 [Chlamydiae bacterium]|nr:Endoribonuclease MazF9 [Chlamydiota bacterium]